MPELTGGLRTELTESRLSERVDLLVPLQLISLLMNLLMVKMIVSTFVMSIGLSPIAVSEAAAIVATTGATHRRSVVAMPMIELSWTIQPLLKPDCELPADHDSLELELAALLFAQAPAGGRDTVPVPGSAVPSVL